MRFKRQDKKEWHDTFMLLPRTINHVTVWLENVQRRLVFKEWGWYEGGWLWEYRLKEQNGKA